MQQKTINDIINYIKLSDSISTAGQPLADEIELVPEDVIAKYNIMGDN